jgi:hypothetical protein
LAASTSKRIFLYRFDRQPTEGVVNPATCFLDTQVEMITTSGTFLTVTYSELKALCFVSDNSQADLFDAHTLFERRPKAPGLWTRFTFRDGAKLDGILSHNLLEWPEHGYFVTPPHAGANRQRVFIPRQALIQTELRGVVGTSAASVEGRRKTEETAARQLPMFE